MFSTWLNDCTVFNATFNIISVSCIAAASAPIHALLTRTLHNILSKPLSAFQHNHHRNNGQQRDRNKSCPNDYHQSQRILAKPKVQTSVLKSSALLPEIQGPLIFNLEKISFSLNVSHCFSPLEWLKFD